MSSVCHSYVIRISLVCTRMSFVCARMSSVCHSYVIRLSLVCTRMPSVLLVCTRMSFVCHSFVVLPWTVLRSSQICPEELLLTLNSINPSIQFIMEYSKDQIPFLDILIKRSESGIWMDLYHKPTDTQRCLPFASSHPNHCKRNIPFCLAWGICAIAKINAEKLKNLENVKSNLSKYHYPDSLIKQGFRKTL